jgi:putative membrane protein insertion efficiency factor
LATTTTTMRARSNVGDGRRRTARRARGAPLRVRACRNCARTVVVVARAREGVAAKGAMRDEESTRESTRAARASEGDEEEEDTMSMKIAMGLLDFYKREVSPILPKSCRFVPTCSEYARQAYRKYGTSKGFVLTAWRIMRCNPFGDKGYDPPMWPPPYLGNSPANLDD